MVEVQKLRTFYDFCKPRPTLCGDSRGRGSKTGDFLRFLQAARDPLRRFVVEVQKLWIFFTIFNMRARPSAEIRVVEVGKLRAFYDLRRFAWSRFENCGLFTICNMRARRSAEIVRVEALSLWRRANLLRRLCVSKRSRCGAVQLSCSRDGL